jgi:hypothetical protein
MESKAKHKFECYKGQGARNRVNSMVIMINQKYVSKKKQDEYGIKQKNNNDLKHAKKSL